MDDIDRWLCELAEQQHGAIARATYCASGLSRPAQRHRLDAGVWVPDGPRVLRRAGAPLTKHYVLIRAVLDAGPGSVLSHAPAGAWWGVPGFDLRHLHVTRPRGVTSHKATFATLHEVLTLRAVDIALLDGIPVVRPERLMLDLCATVHPKRAERALDAAWSRRLLSGPSCRSFLAALAERGRAGIALLRQLLDARGDDYVPPASNLESRVNDILAGAVLGRWRRQVDSGGATWTGRVDFRHEYLPVIVEVQSERYHTALTDTRADLERRLKLEADGFVVVEVWDSMVWHHRDEVVRLVRAAIRDSSCS